jgi:hypothetical protein
MMIVRQPELRRSVDRLFDAIDNLRAGRIGAADAEAEIRTAKAVNRKVRLELRRTQRNRKASAGT